MAEKPGKKPGTKSGGIVFPLPEQGGLPFGVCKPKGPAKAKKPKPTKQTRKSRQTRKPKQR